MGFGLFEQSPLGGVLGAKTCSIFRLDPFTATIPLEPLLDIVPGVTPMRVTLDMIDNETVSHTYALTTHALVDVADATSNVHRELEKMTIAGTLSANIPIPIPVLPLQALPNPLGILRLDLIKLRNLRQMGKDRQPVMVVTPRYAMARAFIGKIDATWKPDDGESIQVSIEFTECRIVSPQVGPALQADYSAQLPGNNAPTGGGQAATSSTPVTPVDSGTPGIPPGQFGGTEGVGAGFEGGGGI
jgi:hypothetical protein